MCSRQRTCQKKWILGKLYEIQISPERGLRNSLKFPSYFGMEYVRPWNMGKKLLERWFGTWILYEFPYHNPNWFFFFQWGRSTTNQKCLGWRVIDSKNRLAKWLYWNFFLVHCWILGGHFATILSTWGLGLDWFNKLALLHYYQFFVVGNSWDILRIPKNRRVLCV